ncbi:MAG: hypothetical protein ACK56F_07080, partial [bacterium]
MGPGLVEAREAVDALGPDVLVDSAAELRGVHERSEAPGFLELGLALVDLRRVVSHVFGGVPFQLEGQALV